MKADNECAQWAAAFLPEKPLVFPGKYLFPFCHRFAMAFIQIPHGFERIFRPASGMLTAEGNAARRAIGYAPPGTKEDIP